MADAGAASRWIEAVADPASSTTARSTYPLLSPADGALLAQVPASGRPEANDAVDKAEAAFASWRLLNVHDRCKALLRWHDAILERSESLAVLTSLEMGKPVIEARVEVAAAAQTISWAANEAPRVWGEVIPSRLPDKHTYTLRQPVGIVYGITPWNFPLAMVTRKAAPALAAGCAVVLKPSEQTPLTAMALARLWAEAGLDPDVFQVLPTLHPAGVTDAILARPSVRKLTFTGSTTVGRALYQKAAAGLRRVSLELGGHAPFIVDEDADLDLAADGILATKFRNAGQTCVSSNRAYVHASIAETFAERLVERLTRMKVGHPLDESVSVGPLVNHRAAQKVTEHIQDATERGAKVLTGGDVDGLHVQPTVLTGIHDSATRIMHEETFGPVLPIVAFEDAAEAIRLANATPYGLAAYIWTASLKRAHAAAAQLDFGLIGINSLSTIESQAPFGGMKDSGVGYEGGKWGVEAFLDTKFVSTFYG